uniref:Uncharacterized protein n=1 Tax=Ursus maritimus TaxID=29073 RepID=A0A452U688_URSMA
PYKSRREGCIRRGSVGKARVLTCVEGMHLPLLEPALQGHRRYQQERESSQSYATAENTQDLPQSDSLCLEPERRGVEEPGTRNTNGLRTPVLSLGSHSKLPSGSSAFTYPPVTLLPSSGPSSPPPRVWGMKTPGTSRLLYPAYS